MSLRDWLMGQNPAGRPVGGVQASESFARRVEAAAELPPAGPVAMAAKAAAESVELYRAAVRAPWVPAPEPTSALTGEQAARAKTAFDRDNHCPVCAYRYSRCYCGTGGDR